MTRPMIQSEQNASPVSVFRKVTEPTRRRGRVVAAITHPRSAAGHRGPPPTQDLALVLLVGFADLGVEPLEHRGRLFLAVASQVDRGRLGGPELLADRQVRPEARDLLERPELLP